MFPFLVIGFLLLLLVLLFLRDFHEAEKYVNTIKNSSCDGVTAKYKYLEVIKNTKDGSYYQVIDMCYNELFQTYRYLLIDLSLVNDSINTNKERNIFKKRVLSQNLPEYTGTFLDNCCMKVVYGYVNHDYLSVICEKDLDEDFVRIMK